MCVVAVVHTLLLYTMGHEATCSFPESAGQGWQIFFHEKDAYAMVVINFSGNKTVVDSAICVMVDNRGSSMLTVWYF